MIESDGGAGGASMAQPPAEQALPVSTIKRGEPESPAQRTAYIQKWVQTIKAAKKHFEKDFKRMHENMDFVYNGADKEWCEYDKYIANITQQYVRQRVAALYARNPKFVCKRRDRMDYMIWDGTPESIQMSEMLAKTNPAMLPMHEALMEDIQQGYTRRRQMDLISRTVELLFEDSIKEQSPNFKKAMKQLIRRVETTGIGWVKADYQRIMTPRPDEETQINDITHRVANIERLQSDKADGKFDENSPENEELDRAELQLRSEPEIIAREGLVYSFPKSTAIIVDPRTRSLEGFQGTDWLAEEFLMTNDEIKAIFKIDIDGCAKSYTEKGEESNQGELFTSAKPDGYSKPTFALVWLVYDKKSGTCFAITEGYKDYLKLPEAPSVTVEQFFPYLCLMFNEMEHDKHIYPLSDVHQIRHIQREYNRAKESLRQHRIASAPLYATGAGQFDEEDQLNLALHNPHDVVVLKGLQEGENVNNKLQMVKKYPIDPNVYETENTFQDLSRVVGTQEANLGSISGATATETSIADDSRVSSLSSNTDDLDEFLSELGRMGGQILLMEMSQEEVKKRVGPGAVWPELTRLDIMNELYLTIEAGSSGRPNKAAKGAALERISNVVLSIPGVSPKWLLKQVLQTVDETFDLSDAYIEGNPSILAMNTMASAAQTQGGAGPNDPTNQGTKGANNKPTAPQNAGGGQPAYTAPGTAQNQFVSQ